MMPDLQDIQNLPLENQEEKIVDKINDIRKKVRISFLEHLFITPDHDRLVEIL